MGREEADQAAKGSTWTMIIESNELHIILVTTDWNESFRILYDGIILFCGDNIPEVLRIFDEMPVIICEDVKPSVTHSLAYN